MSPRRAPSRTQTWVAAVLWGAAAWGLYVIFISSVTPLESAVGAGAAVLAAGTAAALSRVVEPAFGPVRRLAATVVAWPLTACRELGALAVAIAAALARRAPHGRLRRLALREGTGSAWAAGLLSATPGSYVVAVEEENGHPREATVHALFPGRSAVERAISDRELP